MSKGLDIDGLDERERRFVDALASGKGKRDAALAAGAPPKAAPQWAFKALKRERVRNALTKALSSRAQQDMAQTAVDTAYVLKRFKELDGGHRDSIALQAVKMMATHLGMFPERVIMADPKDQSTDELMRNRAALRKRAGLSA